MEKTEQNRNKKIMDFSKMKRKRVTHELDAFNEWEQRCRKDLRL